MIAATLIFAAQLSALHESIAYAQSELLFSLLILLAIDYEPVVTLPLKDLSFPCELRRCAGLFSVVLCCVGDHPQK